MYLNNSVCGVRHRAFRGRILTNNSIIKSLQKHASRVVGRGGGAAELVEERQRRDREGSTGRGSGRKAMRRRRVYKEWRGVELGRGVFRIMHGCSILTMDPGILTMPARSTSGFRRTARSC